MKDYYETKLKRLELILGAFDARALQAVKIAIDNDPTFSDLFGLVNELGETRDLITTDIDYTTKALENLKTEEAE